LSILLLFTVLGTGNVSANNSIPDRDQFSQEFQWKLSNIYTSDDEWQRDFNTMQDKLFKIEQYQGKLGQSASVLMQCLKLQDEISMLSEKLSAYAQLQHDVNIANSHYQDMVGKTGTLGTQANAAMAFIDPEIIKIPDKKLTVFCQEQPDLKDYSFYFTQLSYQKQHVLPVAEEKLLSNADDALQTPATVFDMLTNADISFPDITNEQGQKVQLSEERYRGYIASSDQNVRKQAFQALYSTYNHYRNTLAATLTGNVKANIFLAKAHKYDSSLQAALASDNVPVKVYDNLIETVNDNLEPLHRYIALKKKILGLSSIHMYDLYTPLVSDRQLSYNYEQGIQLVQSALMPLGSEYGAILKQGFSSGWIDVYENKGKQTGAYSLGVYGVHPYVLLNYHDSYDDVSTIAHEMGHALHSYYSESSQPYTTSQYSTFCAETASTTNEVLLMDYMLNTTVDKTTRLYLINQQLEAIRSTIYRQAMFAEFEKMIFDKAEKGDTLTADTLDALWHNLNVKYYGPVLTVDKESDGEWARIPHFYTPFYVYQYVTGYSAATFLAEKLHTEGKPAQARYLAFLKSGGSEYPLILLKRAGIDMSSPAPIVFTIQKFSRLLDELEGAGPESEKFP